MEQKDCTWKPDFKKWYNVKLSAYQFILKQAEDKHNDVLSESESITNKSITISTSLVALFSFFVGSVLKSGHKVSVFEIIFSLVCLIIITLSISLLFPKNIKGRGFSPKDLLPDELDSENETDYPNAQDQKLYYFAIVKLQDKTDTVKAKNEERSIKYLSVLVSAMILFFVGSTYLLFILSRPS